ASDVAKRTFLAPSADRGINDPRVYSGKRRIVDPEPIRDAWPKGLEHDIGLFHQSMPLSLPLISFQIDCGAFLAPIPGQPCRVTAEGVAARWFNLDHLCPEIRQDCCRKSASHTPAEVQNDNSIAWSGHFLLL